MNSAAISLLSEAGFQIQEAEILLRRLLSDLVTPSAVARETIDGLGLSPRDLDPSLRSIAEIVLRLADAGLDEAAADAIFSGGSAPAVLALIDRADRLEELQQA